MDLNLYTYRRITALRSQANEVIGQTTQLPIKIRVKKNSVAEAGRWTFCDTYHDVMISGAIFKNESRELNQTIAHEFCHALCWEMYGFLCEHGPHWSFLMTKLGYPPAGYFTEGEQANVGFEQDSQMRRHGRYVYTCQCGDIHHLAYKYHTEIIQGIAYQCDQCQEHLVYTYQNYLA